MHKAPSTAVLYVSHLVTAGTLWNYMQLRRAVGQEGSLYWVCQGDSARRRLAPLPIETFPVTDELLSTWRPAMNGNGLVPGNCHIPAVAFARQNPHEHYWFVEYDVRYTGSWNTVFEMGRPSDADLIAALVESPFRDPTWYHWETIDLPYADVARSFNPICRASHRLLEEVTKVITGDHWAHNEALLASACRHHGWPMADLNDLARAHREAPLYTPAPDEHATGTLSYRPAQSTVWGAERQRLHHPVKPLRWFQEKFGSYDGIKEALNRWR